MIPSVLVYVTIQDLERFWLAQQDSAWFQEHPILSRPETRLHWSVPVWLCNVRIIDDLHLSLGLLNSPMLL